MKTKLPLGLLLALLLAALQGGLSSQASSVPEVVDLSTWEQKTTFQGGPDSFVGFSITGDFDGDGVSDIVISAPGDFDFRGALHLFKGTSLTPGAHFDLTTQPADATILERSEWGPFWWLSAGDVNGDGVDDILGGATWVNGP